MFRKKRKSVSAEQQFNNVLNYHARELEGIQFPDADAIDASIAESEELLRKLGIEPKKTSNLTVEKEKSVIVVPSWEELCMEAERCVGSNWELESLFTPEELRKNELAVRRLNWEYNEIHKLDSVDISICASAAILGGIIDILLVGIPGKSPDRLKAGPLSDYVREWFDKRYPQEEIERLAKFKDQQSSL